MTAKRTNNAETRGGEKVTAQPLTVPAANGTDNSSDWMRLPPPRQRLWGLPNVAS